VEADEYDRSFLKLVPDVAVITAMDPDHLDIYGTAEEVEKAFIQFSQRVKPGAV
jgi:UDP-N-acetylmuramate--alanine ligase